nr:aminotransferase class I/II-fold pyridoxal phosphate-dependent enzyme [Mesorhizobium sp.]
MGGRLVKSSESLPTDSRNTAHRQHTLGGNLAQYLNEGVSRNVLERLSPLTHWLDERYDDGLDPYCKYTDGEIGPTVKAHGRKGELFEGINFASQDYLNLSTHPAVRRAAIEAVEDYGVHSAGSAALMGNTKLSIALERSLCDFLGYEDCTLFTTGWGAGYGVIRTLVREGDHVIIDLLAHACLMEGARNATRNVHVHPHLSLEGVARRLQKIRHAHPDAGIVVVTESTFSMDSDVPDIRGLQDICTRFAATLIVDCAHDLGALGATGRGYLEAQGMVGAVDILMGSLSKTFASNGGFVATNHRELKLALRLNSGPSTFTNAMSPISANVVRKCLDIVSSPEGTSLRLRLMRNIEHLRSRLTGEGFQVLGQPSAIVPVVLGGDALSRLMTRYVLRNGAVVNLVEYPAVARNKCRWRLQVMADHTADQIDRFVELTVEARADSESSLA